MKVNPAMEENFIPMEAEDFLECQGQRKKRDRYWSMLRRAKLDYLQLTDQESTEYDILDGAFYYYLQQNFGLQIELIDGNIAGEYNIVNEKKYLLFLLKYGQ